MAKDKSTATTSLAHKTIRPGLLTYSSYYSSQAPETKAEPSPAVPARSSLPKTRWLLLATIILVAGLFWSLRSDRQHSSDAKSTAAVPTVNHCAGNSLDKFIKLSISQRRLWACEQGKTAYSAPVITGLQHHPETETPLGTYRIYGKQTNTTLKGTDSRGTWSDPVYYWMPFLDNQYGTYGFHDATWRKPTAFGHISPDSPDASHGCVELALNDSKWLYNWAPVGTTVTVES